MHCQKPNSLEGILTSLTDGVFQIIISNVRKYNALTMTMYKHIGELLVYADSDPAIKVFHIICYYLFLLNKSQVNIIFHKKLIYFKVMYCIFLCNFFRYSYSFILFFIVIMFIFL